MDGRPDGQAIGPICVRWASPSAIPGIGIEPNRLPHILDEYAQANDDIADRYGGSAALDSPFNARLLQLYGSTLNVTSTISQGTTFSFG